jgi:hypothetical protein
MRPFANGTAVNWLNEEIEFGASPSGLPFQPATAKIFAIAFWVNEENVQTVSVRSQPTDGGIVKVEDFPKGALFHVPIGELAQQDWSGTQGGPKWPEGIRRNGQGNIIFHDRESFSVRYGRLR